MRASGWLAAALGAWVAGALAGGGAEVPGEAPGTSAAPAVHFEAGRLTVEARDAPLREVLEAVARAARIEVHLSSNVAPQQISVRFSNLGLAEGLRRILGNQGYALVRDPAPGGGRITALYVVGRGAAATATPPPQGRSSPPATAKSVVESLPPGSLPPGVIEGLHEALSPIDRGLVEKAMSMRAGAIAKLIETLSQARGGDPATASELREYLRGLRSEQGQEPAQ